MANPTPKTDHLKSTQWQAGQSGNPAGKPKGSKHLSSFIQEMLEDEEFTAKLSGGKKFKGAPGKAIAKTLVIKALEGDLRAFDLLAKHGYGTKHDITTKDMPLFDNGTARFIKQID